MRESTATTRCVVAAIVAAVFVLPAAVWAADGATDADAGGGATYYEPAAADGQISLKVASGAWVGRATRLTGAADELAGRYVAIEARRSARDDWNGVASARVGDDGRFATTWKPSSAGRRQLRAVSASASSAGANARAASAAERVTVYRGLVASWYGPGFYGNRTACGGRLTTETLGVAHRTLPCGARVALRYRGRSIVVHVIDRGPYARGVTYDLTSATASRLGVTETRRIGAAVLSR